MAQQFNHEDRHTLELGDNVTYRLDTALGVKKRVGKILMKDGAWYLVRLRSRKLVWVSLRCLS